MAESLVSCTRDGHLAVVTLNRAAKLNSLTPAMLDELARLAVLHRHGALTDDEFIQAKRRLIRG